MYPYYYSSSPMSWQAAMVGFLFIILIFNLLWSILQIVCWWRIFNKAGQEGWKSLIPFYNRYILFKICWKGSYYIWSLVLSFITLFLGLLSLIPYIGILFAIVAFFVGFPSSIISIILSIGMPFKMASAFGKDALFGIGLWLLGFIFFPILAFGNAKYVGTLDNSPIVPPVVVNVFQPSPVNQPYYGNQQNFGNPQNYGNPQNGWPPYPLFGPNGQPIHPVNGQVMSDQNQNVNLNQNKEAQQNRNYPPAPNQYPNPHQLWNPEQNPDYPTGNYGSNLQTNQEVNGNPYSQNPFDPNRRF